ncbi:MAG: PKD domain-containing protein [Planctomycetota bacterium]
MRVAAWYQHCQIVRKEGKIDELISSLVESNTPQSWHRLIEYYSIEDSSSDKLYEAVDGLCKADPNDFGAKYLQLSTMMSSSNRKSNKFTYDDAKKLYDEIITSRPDFSHYLQTLWIDYLKRIGKTEELEALVQHLAAQEFTNPMEISMAISAAGRAEQFEVAVKLLKKAEEQFSASLKQLGGYNWRHEYPRLATLAIKNNKPEQAADFVAGYLQKTRPTTTKMIRSSSYWSYRGGLTSATNFPNATAYYDEPRLRTLEEFYRVASGKGGGGPSYYGFVSPVRRLSPARKKAKSSASKPAGEDKEEPEEPAVVALRKIFEKDLNSKDEEDLVYAHLALAYIDWWSEKEEAAAEHIGTAVKLRPWDISLRIALAQIRYNLDDQKGVIEVLSSMQRRYHPLYKTSQQLLLRAAGELEDRETSKAAALRLFNMRLTSQEQLELASTMHELGLVKKAEQLEQRVQVVSRNDIQQLHNLMEQQLKRKQKRKAARLAQQILRNLGKAGFNEDYYRRSALRVLSESGDLDKMIASAEKQLTKNPNAVRVLLDLWHYYTAKQDYDKAAEAAEKSLSLRPKDLDLRHQYATALLGNKQYTRAMVQLREIMNKDPGLIIGGDIYRLLSPLRRSGQMLDFTNMLLEADWDKLSSSLSQPYRITDNLVRVGREAYQSVGSPPDWLKDFEDTGEVIQLSRATGRRFITAKLFKKTFPTGKVKLGGNIAKGASGRQYNYFVLINPDQQDETAPSKKATSPIPANGAVGVGIKSDLSWGQAIDATAYRIHFGRTNPPPVLEEQTNYTCLRPPEILNHGTTYYWRVDTVTDNGTIDGDLWNFTTANVLGPPLFQTVNIELYEKSIENGISHKMPGDGETAPAIIGNRKCRKNKEGDNDRYMYFGISKEYAYQGNRPEQYITIDYYDTGTENLVLIYDAEKSKYKEDKELEFTGSNTWKRHTFHVTDAYFGDRQHQGSDFRIARIGEGGLYISGVTVGVEPPAPGPVAGMESDKTFGNAPLEVKFSASNCFDPDNKKLVSYTWDFGDGNSGTGKTVSHAYSADGTFTATLTVANSDGQTGTATVGIRTLRPLTITNLNRYELYTAEVGAKYLSDRQAFLRELPDYLIGCQAIRTASDGRLKDDDVWITFDIDRPADIYIARGIKKKVLPEWMYDYIDTDEKVGNLYKNKKGYSKLFRKTYPAGKVILGGNVPKDYDSRRGIGNYYVFIVPRYEEHPQPRKPIIKLSVSATSGSTPLKIDFDASESRDPDGKIVGYEWDFGDTKVTDPTASYTYTHEGLYTAILTLTDDEGLTRKKAVEISAYDSPIKIDNLNRYELTRFAHGRTCYSDLYYFIDSIPAHLCRCLGVRTTNTDRDKKKEEWLTFDLSDQADVYIAYDSLGTGIDRIMPYVDKLNDYLVDNDDGRSPHERSSLIRMRYQILNKLGRMVEGFRYMISMSKVLERFEPVFPASMPVELTQKPLGVKTRGTDLFYGGGWSIPEGRLSGLISDVLDAAGENGQLESMGQFLQNKYASEKDFNTGVWQALVNARLSKYDEVRAAVPQLLELANKSANTYTLRQPIAWLGQEIEKVDELVPLSVRCNELLLALEESSGGGMSGILYSRLGLSYVKNKQRDKARKTFLQLVKLPVSSHYSGAYALERKQEFMYYAADGLNKAGFYKDAYDIASKVAKEKSPRGYVSYQISQAKRLSQNIAKAHPEVKQSASQPSDEAVKDKQAKADK